MKFEVRKTTLQNKLTLNNCSSNGKQTAKRLLIHKFYAVLELFEAWIWTSSKFLSRLETTANIRMCFKNTSIEIYKYQWP